jgi:hypothetical protein
MLLHVCPRIDEPGKDEGNAKQGREPDTEVVHEDPEPRQEHDEILDRIQMNAIVALPNRMPACRWSWDLESISCKARHVLERTHLKQGHNRNEGYELHEAGLRSTSHG